MEFRILGPLEVVDEGRVVSLDAPKQRALLAILLLRANEPVPRDLLIDGLWAGRPPSSAKKVLQTYVSQLRRVLGHSTIRTLSSAYEIRADVGSFDLHRFEQLARSARTATPGEANELLRKGLSLWRGPPLAEFAYEAWAQAEIEQLEELRLDALQERIETDLALGASAELVRELELLVSQYPLRERLRAQLMLALYRSGRQADALEAYRDARRTLVDALGIEPTLALRQLERRILDQDPALELGAEPAASRGLQPELSMHSRSSFVGRTRELRELRTLLRRDDLRLLTLTGAAGAGKTRLALEATSTVEGDPARAVLIELARITDSRLVARTIGERLGAKESPGSTAREALLEYLHGRRILLLLDNFEHVLAAAPLVRELLAGAPGLKVLVTSRAPLDVPEERIYHVPALELPDPSAPTSVARRTEAVRLFVDRARAARPEFELSETNAESVAHLCVRLDGLPLALELAAARSNLLSPRALLGRLDSRLDLLRAAPGSGVSERQRTLRGAIDWSFELLEPEEQQLFTSLGVFVGGFTLDAAQLVADQPELDTLEGLETLLRNSLLRPEHTRGDEPRLGMLETIREYALESLTARGDADAVRRRHADYCLMLAEEAEPGLLGPRQGEWLERLDTELDNIRAALTWAVRAGEAEVGLRIAGALWRFWQLRSHEPEGRERLEELLALGSGSPTTRARAQTWSGSLAWTHGDLEATRRALEESIPVHRREGHHAMLARALGILAFVAVGTRDTDSGLALAREALEAARKAGDPNVESNALLQLGATYAARGELEDAEAAIEEAVRLARMLGNTRSVAAWQQGLAGIALIRGDRVRARSLYDESLAIHRNQDDAWGVSHSLANLALLAFEGDDVETARTLLTEALGIQRKSGNQRRLAAALELSGRLSIADGQPLRAVRLYARAAKLREVVGTYTFDLGWPEPAPTIEGLRSRVGESTFAEEWERGRALSLLDAIDEAMAIERELEPPQTPQMNQGTAAPM